MIEQHLPPRIGSLCTGYGGLDMAVELVLGGQLTWYAEVDRHARTVLEHHWPGVPNLGDIRTVDWATVPRVDVLTAGFPCLNDNLGGPLSGGADAVAD
ncbi:DNA cytosine methyltransferase [Micromonospora globbae]|uniref:DNA cytosine methyltransferase n=1 Tax=Micromonospora globbae TaxID=1894969 RepID=UPI001F00A305|nr:DNA cytosine methyltransferase [Micromonospora globbae]